MTCTWYITCGVHVSETFNILFFFETANALGPTDKNLDYLTTSLLHYFFFCTHTFSYLQTLLVPSSSLLL